MSTDRIVRWGGIAAAVGGLVWLFPWTGWVEVGDAAGFALAVIGLLLVMIGLIGLQRRLADNGSATYRPAYGLALLGAVLVVASAVGGLLTGASMRGSDNDMGVLAIFLFAGMLALIAGIAGMGLTTLRQKALGRFSFAPLLLAAAQLAYVVSIGLNISNDSLHVLLDIFVAVSVVCWLILGYAMTAGQTPAVDQPATA